MALAAVVLVLVGVAGLYTWLSFTRTPRLALVDDAPRTPVTSPATSDPLIKTCRSPALSEGAEVGVLGGLWVIQPDSIAGFRVGEKFVELASPHEAVARTNRVAGWVLIADSGSELRIETGCVAVELSTLQSVDRLPMMDARDRDFAIREFLETAAYPYAVFQPYPQLLPPATRNGSAVRLQISGQLDLHGVAKAATFGLDVRVRDQAVAAAGSAMIAGPDYGVEVTRGPANLVSVDKNFTLEISLVLTRP
jgi:hypothetical protein